jgi:hypothetical protein
MERWITARTAIAMSFERASQYLMGDPSALLRGDRAIADGSGWITALSVETRNGASVRQDVVVTLGPPCSAEGETWVPIEWQPVAHAQLLPSFTGVVELVDGPEGADLAITGIYDVPLGFVGRFGDGLVGRRIAQSSIRTLLDGMARKLRGVEADELVHASWRPAPYPISLRERPVPELHPAGGGPDGEAAL